MTLNGETILNYYSYISITKIDQLHDQISDFSLEKKIIRKDVDSNIDGEVGAKALLGYLKAKLKFGRREHRGTEEIGSLSTLHKLDDVLKYINEHKVILDLNELLENSTEPVQGVFCFSYTGEFEVKKKSFSQNEEHIKKIEDENRPQISDGNNRILNSGITLLHSKCGDFEIELACSNRFFSDMGGSYREDKNEWFVSPHSGNYHFFSGKSKANFKCILFMAGRDSNLLYATPLFLVHDSTATLMI